MLQFQRSSGKSLVGWKLSPAAGKAEQASVLDIAILFQEEADSTFDQELFALFVQGEGVIVSWRDREALLSWPDHCQRRHFDNCQLSWKAS